jgi:hypothetical protein
VPLSSLLRLIFTSIMPTRRSAPLPASAPPVSIDLQAPAHNLLYRKYINVWFEGLRCLLTEDSPEKAEGGTRYNALLRSCIITGKTSRATSCSGCSNTKGSCVRVSFFYFLLLRLCSDGLLVYRGLPSTVGTPP